MNDGHTISHIRVKICNTLNIPTHMYGFTNNHYINLGFVTIAFLQLYIYYLYAIGPDLDTANLGRGLRPVLPEVDPSFNFTFRLEL